MLLRPTRGSSPAPNGGAPTLESQRWNFDTSVLYPLTTGGAFALSFVQSTTDTSFPGFTGVADQHEIADAIALSFSQPLLRRRGVAYNTSIQRENDMQLAKSPLDRIKAQYDLSIVSK